MMAELMNMNKTIGMNNEHLNMYKTKLFVEEVTKRAASSATKPQLSEAPLQKRTDHCPSLSSFSLNTIQLVDALDCM